MSELNQKPPWAKHLDDTKSTDVFNVCMNIMMKCNITHMQNICKNMDILYMHINRRQWWKNIGGACVCVCVCVLHTLFLVFSYSSLFPGVKSD